MRLSRGLRVVKVLRSPVRQTHPQASDVVSTHIITSLLDEIQKHSMCDAWRLYHSSRTSYHHAGTQAWHYMALADVLLQLWLKVSPGSWWVGTTGQGTPMKCSHAHECCDRHQMSWQRPTVSTDHHLPHTHMSTCTHIAFGRDMHSMQCVSHSACNLTHNEWIVHSAINALLHTFSFLTNPKGIFLSAGFSQLMMKKN